MFHIPEREGSGGVGIALRGSLRMVVVLSKTLIFFFIRKSFLKNIDDEICEILRKF